jgi:hypothetical protein
MAEVKKTLFDFEIILKTRLGEVENNDGYYDVADNFLDNAPNFIKQMYLQRVFSVALTNRKTTNTNQAVILEFIQTNLIDPKTGTLFKSLQTDFANNNLDDILSIVLPAFFAFQSVGWPSQKFLQPSVSF